MLHASRVPLPSTLLPPPHSNCKMDDTVAELNELFAGSAPDGLPKDVLAELQSVLRVHSISPQELFYKWESYCLKMGAEETRLTLDTARSLKHDIQESLERETRSRAGRQMEKRNAVTATPRARGSTDVFRMSVNRVLAPFSMWELTHPP